MIELFPISRSFSGMRSSVKFRLRSASHTYNATSSSLLSQSVRVAHPLGMKGFGTLALIYSSNVFSGIEQETAKLGISTTSVILKLAATLANM